MKWKIIYYNKSTEQVIFNLEKSLQASYTAIIDMMLEHGPDLGLPFTRALGGGLFEIRAKGIAGIARSFFCTIEKSTIVILHTFVKKTQKIPKKELKLANKRLREVKNL